MYDKHRLATAMLPKQTGLTSQQAKELLTQFGPNKLRDTEKKPLLIQILKQFMNPLIVVLLIVSGFSLLSGEAVEAGVISGVIVMNCLIGFFQERKAEHAVDSIKKLISLKSKVYRDSVVTTIDAEEIVPGDLVVLEAGDKVPADGTIIEARNLQINEAQLTGEAYPVLKKEKEKAFMSSIVTNGRGLLQATETGMKTEIGQITGMVARKGSDKAPLELRFKELTRRIIAFVLFACTTVFITGLFQGHGIGSILKTSISLGVSAIPEGLPVVVTITLAIGVYRMSRQKAIIKNLPSASTLAGIDVICTDKTGTITEGKIELVDTWVFKSEHLLESMKDHHFMKLGILCNDAHITGGTESGDLLDISILNFAAKEQIEIGTMRKHHKRLDDIPFDSEYKYQATLNYYTENENIVIVKGAPEMLLNLCRFNTDTALRNVENKIQEFAENGFRLILLASKFVKESSINHNSIRDLDLNGILVFIDPLRSDVYDAIQKCQQSGIQTIMITGDHAVTAKHIAQQAGISGPTDQAITASELGDLASMREKSAMDSVSVVARANPMDKVKLVDYFDAEQKTVAMTGDGVNDAPALVKADIGIAMGENGTDAAREAADMILLDNKFSTIVKGIQEARIVYENLKKVITYLFSTSFGEILTIFLSVLNGLPLPLIAVQVLWLNLITDGFLTTAVALDEKHDDIMRYRPSRYKKNILDKLMIGRSLFMSTIMACGSVLIFSVTLAEESLEYSRTAILIVMAIFQWFNAFNARSENNSIFSVGIFSNKYIIGAVSIEAVLLLFAVYNPFMQTILQTVPVQPKVWVYAILMASTIVIFEEIRKAYFKSLKQQLHYT